MALRSENGLYLSGAGNAKTLYLDSSNNATFAGNVTIKNYLFTSANSEILAGADTGGFYFASSATSPTKPIYIGGTNTTFIQLLATTGVGINTSTFGGYATSGRGILAVNGSASSMIQLQLGGTVTGYLYTDTNTYLNTTSASYATYLQIGGNPKLTITNSDVTNNTGIFYNGSAKIADNGGGSVVINYNNGITGSFGYCGGGSGFVFSVDSAGNGNFAGNATVNGFVGIGGAVNGSYRLNVTGKIYASSEIVTNSDFHLTNDAYIYSSAGGAIDGFLLYGSTHNVLVKTNGTTALTVDSSQNAIFAGKVGIGTSSPAYSFVVSNSGALGFEVDPTAGGGTQVNILVYNRVLGAYKPIYLNASQFNFGSGNIVSTIDRGFRSTYGGDDWQFGTTGSAFYFTKIGVANPLILTDTLATFSGGISVAGTTDYNIQKSGTALTFNTGGSYLFNTGNTRFASNYAEVYQPAVNSASFRFSNPTNSIQGYVGYAGSGTDMVQLYNYSGGIEFMTAGGGSAATKATMDSNGRWGFGVSPNASFKALFDGDIKADTLNTIQGGMTNGMGAWKLGKVVNNTVSLDTTRFVEVEIDGVVIRLAVIN